MANRPFMLSSRQLNSARRVVAAVFEMIRSGGNNTCRVYHVGDWLWPYEEKDDKAIKIRVGKIMRAIADVPGLVVKEHEHVGVYNFDHLGWYDTIIWDVMPDEKPHHFLTQSWSVLRDTIVGTPCCINANGFAFEGSRYQTRTHVITASRFRHDGWLEVQVADIDDDSNRQWVSWVESIMPRSLKQPAIDMDDDAIDVERDLKVLRIDNKLAVFSDPIVGFACALTNNIAWPGNTGDPIDAVVVGTRKVSGQYSVELADTHGNGLGWHRWSRVNPRNAPESTNAFKAVLGTGEHEIGQHAPPERDWQTIASSYYHVIKIIASVDNLNAKEYAQAILPGLVNPRKVL